MSISHAGEITKACPHRAQCYSHTYCFARPWTGAVAPQAWVGGGLAHWPGGMNTQYIQVQQFSHKWKTGIKEDVLMRKEWKREGGGGGGGVGRGNLQDGLSWRLAACSCHLTWDVCLVLTSPTAA